MKKINEFKEPWLIQRLEKPYVATGDVAPIFTDNPFSFGGGMVNGGFSKEAWAIVKKICGFDYMGSAEFEWGAVPKALGELLEHSVADNVTFFSWTFDRAKYPSRKDLGGRFYSEHIRSKGKDGKEGRLRKKEIKVPLPVGEQTVWAICLKGHEENVKSFVMEDLKKQHSSLKECTCFYVAVDPVGSYATRIVGWFELGNPFMWFIDEAMFNGFMELVKAYSGAIKVPAEAEKA